MLFYCSVFTSLAISTFCAIYTPRIMFIYGVRSSDCSFCLKWKMCLLWCFSSPEPNCSQGMCVDVRSWAPTSAVMPNMAWWHATSARAVCPTAAAAFTNTASLAVCNPIRFVQILVAQDYTGCRIVLVMMIIKIMLIFLLPPASWEVEELFTECVLDTVQFSNQNL